MELSDLINNGQALGETAPGVFGGLDVLTETEASGTYVAQGAAVGGDLAGALPAPTIAPGTITNAKIAVGADIGRSKIAAVEAWRTVGAAGQPAFAAGWAAFTTGGYRPVGFRLDPLTGLVHLAGVAQATTDPVANATIFTLPADYLPAFRQSVRVQVTGGSSVITVFNVTGVVSILADLAINGIVYLDGVSFPVG